MYWVSVIIQNEHDARAWRCSCHDGYDSFDDAMECVREYRDKHTVLAAWITEDSGDGSSLVFFKCYVNIVGAVEPLT